LVLGGQHTTSQSDQSNKDKVNKDDSEEGKYSSISTFIYTYRYLFTYDFNNLL